MSRPERGRPRAPRQPRARRGKPAGSTEAAKLTHHRLTHLYELSKILSRFESVERTVLEVLAGVSRVLPLRSGVFIGRADEGRQLIIWHTPALAPSEVEAAREHALSTFAYFAGPGVATKSVEARTDAFAADRRKAPRGPKASSAGKFIVLPLLAGQGPLLGALQVEGVDLFREPDLGFVNAVANLLAVSLAGFYARQALEKSEREKTLLNEELEKRVKKRTNELEAAFKHLDAFSYSVAHDLRAPLRAMNSYSQILIEEYGGKVLDETGQDFARRVAEAARRMDRLVQDLLEYSHLTRAEIPIERVDLDALLAEVLMEMESELAERQAEVAVEAPIPPVLAHRSTLRQVLKNLLSNGVKFVAEGVRPRVRIHAESGPRLARLWFEDNGVGVPPKYQGRIFGVFERLHKQEDYPGTGIGLAIAKKSMERMGGRIGVESEPGQGSRFWIELPKGDP